MELYKIEGKLDLEDSSSVLEKIAKQFDANIVKENVQNFIFFPDGVKVEYYINIQKNKIPTIQSWHENLVTCEYIFVKKSIEKHDVFFEFINELKQALVRIPLSLISDICKTLPLLKNLIEKNTKFEDVAIIWRDHFLEDNLALLEAFVESGVPRQSFYVLDKGDKTINREMIKNYFLYKNYNVDLLDNEKIQADVSVDLALKERLLDFIAIHRKMNKKIIVIDDGGLLHGVLQSMESKIDLYIELTIPGIKKILNQSVNMPVVDLARSELKRQLCYPEIGRACFFRILELLRHEKISGRNIVIVGFGRAGEELAKLFKGFNAQVCIVDTDYLRLVKAADSGYRTFKNLRDCLSKVESFLLIGSSGEISINVEDLFLLGNDSYFTGIATKDLSILKSMSDHILKTHLINDIGTKFIFKNGKQAYQLGDGRSINLFNSESISNKSYDIFKSATYQCVKSYVLNDLCLPNGILLDLTNSILDESGLYRKYYDIYYQEI